MHRFRKKSDAKRSPYLQQQSEPLPPPPQSLPGVLPELPPESDFRTSLILPDLSRRFSVLRSSSGAILSVDALRLKFAEQRARGDQVQVTEEEEDMLFETLGLRNRGAAPSKSQENVSDTAGSGRRYSNNLFGSGKLRDHTYIRNARGSSRAQSAASSDVQYEDSVRSAPLNVPSPYGEQPTFAKSAFKRASLALEHAIHEMEEEDAPEDEVVLPRSAPIVRSSIEQRLSPEPPGMAISSDKQLRKDLEERRASPVPARTLPGYIPGMPRPMTPRDTDSDDQRSYSTTPRATSPTNFTFPNRNESASPTFSSSVMSSYARREAAGSVRHSPAPTSSFSSTPLFLQRSPNGRHTPDDSRMDIAIDFDQSLNASILGRRRAASPLSSSYSTSMGSRPGTPSNSAAWPQPPSSPPQPRRGHSRNASWFTDETASDAHPTIDQVNVPMRSLKSPALPDSPLIDRGHAVMDSISSSQYSSDKRPASPMSGLELGAANPYTRVIRTPTPTEGPSRSPAFSNGGSPRSQRSSRQNGSIHNYNYSSFNNPLVFSPPASSSRSSLESTGSSYHSWEGDRNDNLSTLFNDSDAQPSWYDVSVSDQTSSITSAGFVEEEAEAILQAIGLKRADFMVIQEKLVEFANTKVSSSETTPQRSQSLRRRRPSTSQSNYSFNGRIASPPPQTPSSPSNAVFPTVITEPPRKDDSDSPEDPSPTTRKNRAIADLLFGSEEPEALVPPTSTYEDEAQSPSLQIEADPPIPPPSNLPIPYTQARNPSTPKLPQTAEEEAELEREVERKTTAAMLALKGSASKSNLNLSDSNGNTSRKRISPNQISTPTFVSSSTSVDAIPLRSPVAPTSTSTSGSSKMSRFKKLQGTLRRPKQLPTGEEVTPFPIDFRSQDGSQSITYTPEPPTIIASSAVEPRFKVTVQSPPASAGPGLKGFMARFRSKSRTIDPSPQVVSRHSPHSFNASTPDLGHSKTPRAKSVPLTSEPSSSQTIRGDGRSSPMTPRGSSPSDAPQLAAIRQFFDLGHEIGLDRDQLDSLVRSASTSSKATALSGLTRNKSKSLSRNNSMAQALSRNNSVTLSQATTLKRNNSSVVFNQPEGHVDSLAPSRRGQSSAHHGASLTPQRSMRKAPPEFTRRPPREREHDRDQDAEDLARQTIVRRTIIMPSDLRASGFDLNAIMPKNATHRRRQSVTSNSSRSVQERAPTPPPTRSLKRQSRDVPPPLPHQETASPTSEGRLQVPGMEPSNSNYDSLYEMYTGDGRPSPAHEARPALEVIELANGKTIWQIVNGLRDDDAESIYTGRASMASEYEEDEMQIYVKERSGSASSNHRKSVKASRPETKVFYSSPAHIGRLIEGLSQGMDAGSFNFRGNNPPAHSTTSSMSSDPAWTVEERLDHMLGSMRVT